MGYCVNPECVGRSNPDDATVCQSCQTPLVLQQRYRVVKPLHPDQAALAEVFLVVDIQANQTHKVLKTLISANPIAKKLFEQEQTLLQTFRHPGIPRGEESFLIPLDNGRTLPCLIMEYIEGKDLEQWLNQHGAIDQKLALNWLRQLVDILDFIHQRGFFHRDIKPANIMRRQTGQLALIDFGIAREIPKSQGEAMTVVGTPGYAPEEQWQGQSVPQSDFYALGMTLIRLLTQLHPGQHPAQPQTWRSKTIHPVEPAFADLLERMIAPKPEARPANTALLLKAIDRLNSPVSSLFDPPSPPPVRRTLVRLGAVAAVGMLGAWAWSALSPLFSPKACDLKLGDRMSCGEEMLVPRPFTDKPPPPEKQQGIEAFAKKDYQQAYQLLDAAWKQQRDPETLIYRNNAWIQFGTPPTQRYTIAVSVPLPTPDQTYDVGLEVLRGVAQAQQEAIEQQKLNLQVLITDDGNTPAQAEQAAEVLVRKPDLMAVVGHYASEVSLAALPIYQDHQLVSISPASTSTKLTLWGNEPEHVFFRTVSTTRQHAFGLFRYLNKTVPNPKVAVFYNHSSNSEFSRSMKEEFVGLLPPEQVIAPAEFNLANPRFNATVLLQAAHQQGANAMAIFPDGHTSSNTFQNSLNLIAANQGKLPIVGANTLHSFELLKQVGQSTTERFVLTVVWHSLKSANSTFPKDAEALWSGTVGGRTATSFDAVQVLTTALRQNPSNRAALQRILADPNFKSMGATGEISFIGGDRREDNTVLVKVVPQCLGSGYRFVPVEFNASCYQTGE